MDGRHVPTCQSAVLFACPIDVVSLLAYSFFGGVFSVTCFLLFFNCVHAAGGMKVPVPLNSDDPLFSTVRDLHVGQLMPFLQGKVGGFPLSLCSVVRFFLSVLLSPSARSTVLYAVRH